MMPLTEYLIKVSLGFAVVTLLYWVVLRRLTFYNWNRYYLLIAPILCFAVPFIDVNAWLEAEHHAGYGVIRQIPSISHVMPVQVAPMPARAEVPAAMPDDAPVDWVLVVWIAGVLVMLGRLVVHAMSLRNITRRARLAYDDGVRIYHLDEDVSPFSCGNVIFFNPSMHRENDLPDIILHELTHVRQRHFLDVMWGEMLCVVGWFNPAVWLLKRAMRENLEYIADREVLENHPDVKAYQYLLLQTSFRTNLSLANQLGYRSIRQRIVMMNRHRSPRVALTSFLLLLPLIALLLAAFRSELPGSTGDTAHRISRTGRVPSDTLHISGFILDHVTGKPVAHLPLKIQRQQFAPLSENAFLTRGPVENLTTIYTDEGGFFLQSYSRDSPNSDLYTYYVGIEKQAYNDFSFTPGRYMPGHVNVSFSVIFATKKGTPGSKRGIYWIDPDAFYAQHTGGDITHTLKHYLQSQLSPILAENRLRAEFKQQHKFPREVITQFKNGYFDREKELMGYVGELHFKLNGEPATYQQVNAAFHNYPYQLDGNQEIRQNQGYLNTEISYLTFPLYRDAPPRAIVKGNVEVMDARRFDLATLKKEPYLLDGFRQVAGVGSNLMPQKHEIKRVILLKGRLARYYDRARDRIWWIETRPVPEVYGRPDFAAR